MSWDWGIFWSALTAVGTVGMAVATWWVIRQNTLHHQNGFRPVCVLVPEHGVDPGYSRSDILKHSPKDQWHGVYAIHAALKNVGVGPALNITLEIRFGGFDGYGVRWALSPLAKEGVYGDCDHPLLIPVTFGDRFNATDFQTAPNSVWEIFIEYQDCFENVFHTRHTKNPQEPWSSFGEGRIPKGARPEEIALGQLRDTEKAVEAVA